VSIWVPPRGHFGPKESRVPKKVRRWQWKRYEKPLAARGEGTLDPVNRGAATDRQGCDPWTSLFQNLAGHKKVSNRQTGREGERILWPVQDKDDQTHTFYGFLMTPIITVTVLQLSSDSVQLFEGGGIRTKSGTCSFYEIFELEGLSTLLIWAATKKQACVSDPIQWRPRSVVF
jgi:hypothetical protein